MTMSRTAILHECNTAKLAVEQEFKNLELNFILYSAKTDCLNHFDINEILNEHSKNVPETIRNKDYSKQKHFNLHGHHFLGTHDITDKSLIIFKRTKKQIFFLINTGNETEKTTLLFDLYNLFWHAIQPKEQYSSGELNSYIYQNLLADVFATVLLKQSGRIAHVNKLGRIRCRDLFEQQYNFHPQYYPLPIACEAIMMLLEDIKFSKDKEDHKTPIKSAIDITWEVAETFDQDSIKQWLSFAEAAHNMAWQNLDKNKILQTAIYTCEDPFVRANAYLVAEFLNITPYPVSDTNYYNPFTDDEANERLHNRLCRSQITNLIDNLDEYTRIEDFTLHVDKIIAHQNKNLLNGVLVGWCVPAMIKAKNRYKKLQDDEDLKLYQRIKDLQSVFTETFEQISWHDLYETQKNILRCKHLNDFENIESYLDKSKSYHRDIKVVFANMKQTENT